MLALVRTSTSTDRHDGMSQLLIDLRSPGVEVRPIEMLNGAHDFNQVALREVLVPRSALIGQLGQGWQQVLAELQFERSGPERFLTTYPLLAATAADAGEHVDDRVAERLGVMVARLLALRELSWQVAAALNSGRSVAVEAALVKERGTAFEREVIEICRGLAGSTKSALQFDSLLTDSMLAGPGFTLRGGTTEILRGIVARGLRL